MPASACASGEDDYENGVSEDGGRDAAVRAVLAVRRQRIRFARQPKSAAAAVVNRARLASRRHSCLYLSGIKEI